MRISVVVVAAICLAGWRFPARAEDEGVPISGDDVVVERGPRHRAGPYHLRGADAHGVKHGRGKDVVLDLRGVVIVGHAGDAAPTPDQFAGVGVSLRDAPGAQVLGGHVRGFKIGVRVHDSPGAVLDGIDASGNWKQRLRSTVEREDASDWLWGHRNDDGEWEQKYGAGIAVARSPGVVVRNCVVRDGQNGLLLQWCDKAQVYDCDFSFDSGWGLAMWRTCDAVIARNSLDWCVRGYSHGRYARGQDSTGFLVYEQCHRNTFALNSATHGGDGFFLFAGLETLEKTGEGGCNDNLLWKNDFSHAVANGIEATFSSGNRFLENRLDDCANGVWAGYSWDTEIAHNEFSRSERAIAIEHGHDNRIWLNRFAECGTAVHLWTDDDPDLAKNAFGKKHRDTRSRANDVSFNSFWKCGTDVLLHADTGTTVALNHYDGEPKIRLEGGTTETKVDLTTPKTVPPPDVPHESKLSGTRDTRLPKSALRGRKYILVDEWGPVDPQATRLFPAEVAASGTAKLSVLGTDGAFEVTSLTDGFVAEPAKGELPATVVIRRADGAAGTWPFELTVTAKGTQHHARGTLFAAQWDVRFFQWTKDPREGADAWKALVAGEPVERRTVDAIDFAWQGGKVSDAVGADRFATVATTTVDLPAGRWRLATVSDDGIRVWVDEKLVVDDWTWHGPTPHDVDLDLAAGEHTIRVEHFEIDGWAVLSVGLVPRD